MKLLKLLPAIFFVFQYVPAQAAKATEHFELMDMSDPSSIRQVDGLFVSRADENSVQQGIRLYSLAMEAWNPSLKNTNTRLQIMAHVKSQGVINGLIAPAMSLIDHAMQTNDFQFAAKLAAMIKHISPALHRSIENKWVLQDTTTSFKDLAVKSDPQIADIFSSLLGSSFNAYANGEKSFEQFVVKNDIDLKKLNLTAQDLLKIAVEKGPSKNAYSAELTFQCLTKSTPLPESKSNFEVITNTVLKITPDSSLAKCMEKTNPTFQSNQSLESPVNQTSWVSSTDCEENAKAKKEVSGRLREKMANELSRTGDVNWACVFDCGTATAIFVSGAATFGAEIGTIAGPYGTIAGGVTLGGFAIVAGIRQCPAVNSCSGKKIEDELVISQIKESQKRTELLNLQIEQEKRNQERKRKETENLAKEKALNDLDIDETKIIHGVDSCSTNTCDFSSTVETDISFKSFQMKLEREELKRKRIEAYYQAKQKVIETNPNSVQSLIATDDAALKSCLKDQWVKEYDSNSSRQLLQQSPAEKAANKKNQLKRNLESITNQNPWDKKSLMNNGGH
ncbi:hypothetical protein [Bdellovibrio sp. HCB209]|uniref:hypothetical protein n=1 Tax=Bdellovibrio sp. HCB209 TaxID=3394354 RepID=UPI0039B5943C